jgi:hypothetical protein
MASSVPIASMAPAEGPTKAKPCASHADAKFEFSDKNPYPGCIAVAPALIAACTLLGVKQSEMLRIKIL